MRGVDEIKQVRHRGGLIASRIRAGHAIAEREVELLGRTGCASVSQERIRSGIRLVIAIGVEVSIDIVPGRNGAGSKQPGIREGYRYAGGVERGMHPNASLGSVSVEIMAEQQGAIVGVDQNLIPCPRVDLERQSVRQTA